MFRARPGQVGYTHETHDDTGGENSTGVELDVSFFATWGAAAPLIRAQLSHSLCNLGIEGSRESHACEPEQLSLPGAMRAGPGLAMLLSTQLGESKYTLI